jgi:hypothetical protein
MKIWVVLSCLFVMPSCVVYDGGGEGCWDTAVLGTPGECDDGEDTNGDGICSALDCGGARGAMGEKGDKGEKGDPGDKGDMGEPGPAGASPFVIDPRCQADADRGTIWVCNSDRGECPPATCATHSGPLNDHVYVCLRTGEATFEWMCIR